MVKKELIFFFIVFSIFSVKAQQIYSITKYPLVAFRQPLDIIPISLSGSFGEIRSNHFHSGIDFRTNQREGYPVYAIADGYISRIRVQNSGFGLALYLIHSNGYTSVYGHLSRFAPQIERTVKQKEYFNKTFELDYFPNPTDFPVYKGDIIAYSGNRGSSGGPHLHFEIRDSKTEQTINPQLFGIQTADTIPPEISALYLYQLNKRPFNAYTKKKILPIIGMNGKYTLKNPKTILINGEIGFGISATDKHSGNSGINGIYAIRLELDGKIIFTSAVERFMFEHSKAVNSHIDYPTFIVSRKIIQKSFVDPGNPLQLYTSLVNNGRILFNDNNIHRVKYSITDVKGNESILTFQIKSDGKSVIQTPSEPKGYPMSYQKDNEFTAEGLKIRFAKGTLYNDVELNYKVKANRNLRGYSKIHQIHNNLTPLHTGFEIWIRPDIDLGILKNKAVIIDISGRYQGGAFEQGYIKATPKNFGSFYIVMDTIAPMINPINISEGKDMRQITKMSFRIRDALSGIKSFNGYIDGNWVLMEFDAKTATLWHTFDERTSPGRHELKLIVEDMKENTNEYLVNFHR